MVNVGVKTFRHIILGFFGEVTPHNRVIGRFSDVVRYDLIITDRMGRYHSKF